jgi:uncharacterized protein YjbJ (UPF0337 family)
MKPSIQNLTKGSIHEVTGKIKGEAGKSTSNADLEAWVDAEKKSRQSSKVDRPRRKSCRRVRMHDDANLQDIEESPCHKR